MPKSGLFPSCYLGPLSYYYLLSQHSSNIEDTFENFVKQTFRNRFYMLSPTGIQCLSVPLLNVKRRQKLKDIKISYAEDWQKIHWKSLESGYRRSPYFEYYEDEIYPLFHEKNKYLIDLNTKMHAKMIELLQLDVNSEQSEEYIEATDLMVDYRASLSPKKLTTINFPEYMQVFGDRNDFAPNLSIVDLLFNLGPSSVNYIKSISQ